MTELLGSRGWRRTGPRVVSGVPGLVEGIAIGIKAGRRGISGRRRPAVGLTSVAATTTAISGARWGSMVSVAARWWRRGRTVVAAATSALVSLIRTASSMMRLRTVISLARVAAAVVRHDDEGCG